LGNFTKPAGNVTAAQSFPAKGDVNRDPRLGGIFSLGDVARAHPDWLRAKQEQAMKLNAAQLNQTLSQFDAQVLPDSHPAVHQLNDLFGDHTFFLDASGLNVLEPAETPEIEGEEVQTGEVVSLASWSDETLTSLKPHEPEPTGVVIVLEPRH
jgi:hypothetical protein